MEPIIITNAILGIFLFFLGVLSSVVVVDFLLPKDKVSTIDNKTDNKKYIL